MELEEGSSLVPGVGDEVVLFFLFIVTSVIIVFCLSSRRNQTRDDATGQMGMPEEVVRPNQDNAEGVRQRRHNVERGVESESPPTANEQQVDSGSAMLSVRLVAMDSVQNVTVNERTTLLEIQRDYFQNAVDERRRIRFIYQGHDIADLDASLLDIGIRNNSSLHVHIGQTEGTLDNQQPIAPEEQSLDLSVFFLPLLGLLLGVVWTSFLLWPYVFSLLTKLMLFILSVCYVYMFYTMRSS